MTLFASRVPAGFHSPADDYIDMHLDLNDYPINCPAVTYHVQVSSDTMIDAGIVDGDILVVNRSLEATHYEIVVAIAGVDQLVGYTWSPQISNCSPRMPTIP